MIDLVDSKPKMVPELRFPEFDKDGEWEEKPLISIADKNVRWSFTGGPFGSNLKASDYMSNGIRILQLQNIGDGEFLDEYKIYTSLEKADELLSCNIYAGDIILSKMGDPVGRACIIPDQLERCVMASDGIRLVVNEIKYSKYFIYSLLNSKQIRAAIEKKSTGSTRKRIGLNELKEVQLPLPRNLPEQQKIASCLSSLDELITANREKLEALQSHKKGLMQNLFPQEGQTVPNYRFPEFENDGEWEEKKLDRLAKRGSGHTPNKKMPNYYNGGVKWVSLADSNKLDNGYIYTTKIQISKEGIENSSAVLHPSGTVILSRDAGIGKSAVLYSEMSVSQHFITWTCDETKLSNWFLYYVLQILKPVFENIAVGSTIKTIGMPYFKELSISLPSILEQQKIASCLLALDELINSQTEKIEQLQNHKKGLMQGLFPKNLD